ncbi:fluoride efflux transporter CrcB [Staphylococcus xylosus]|uniref:fluoride efflux transporter CrcB n=1 Tax=Staphylococcus xylosus TaxID=1288 RepID=UPI00298F0FAB|nr:fluoride efflux transporter CrcB [Staphylococcus xylosus]MDW8554105.1 fluoride efflux transporter CrcB [Staphylococcus xylosus]
MQYLYIFVGGAVGALLRYLFSFISVNSTFPIGTFIANILGAFLMGFLGTLTLQYYKNNPLFKKGITTGLLGAMTTFSTFQFELIHLFEQQAYLAVSIYAISSYVLGILLCYIGVRLGYVTHD